MAAAENTRSARADDGLAAIGGAAERRPAADWRLGALVLAAMLVVYVSTAGGSLATTDAVVNYDVTRQLVEHRSIALSANLVGNQAYLGPDGQYYSPFGILQAWWNIPFYVAGRTVASVLPGRAVSPEMLTKAAVALGNAVAAALAAWLAWLLAAWLSGSARTAVAAAWMTGFASVMWPYSKFGFNVPLAAVLLLAAAYFSLKTADDGNPRHAWAAGLMCGLALLTRHELILAAIPSLGLLVRVRPRAVVRLSAWWFAGALPAVLVWAWYNNIRFGSPIETGYLRDDTLGMGGSFAQGLWGLFLSPGGSLFLYSPLVLAAVPALVRLRRTHARFAWTTIATVVIFTLLYAQLGSWAGGRSYGPRYLVPLVPLLMVAVAVWGAALTGLSRRLLIALCALSVMVQAPGVLVDFAKVRVNFARAVGGPAYETRMHEWSSCPLALNTTAALAAVPAVAKHLTGIEAKPRVVHEPGGSARDFSQQFAFSLDFWWVYLYYLGVLPAWASLAAGAMLWATGCGLLWLTWRRAGRVVAHAATERPVVDAV